MDKKDYDQAIREYDQAIQLDPGYAAAYNNRYATGAGHGAPAAHAAGGAPNGKPPAPKPNARQQHPKAPTANGKNEEKTAQR